jgi:hypothetical protein
MNEDVNLEESSLGDQRVPGQLGISFLLKFRSYFVFTDGICILYIFKVSVLVVSEA